MRWRTSCARTRRLIARAFVDEEIGAVDARALWQHLAACPACRGHYDQVMGLDRMLASGGQSARLPSPLEYAVVGAAVRGAGQPRVPRWYGVWQPQAWRQTLVQLAAALVLVTVGGIIVWQYRQTDRWQVRQAGATTFAVRAFCQTRDIAGQPLIRSISSEPSPQEVASCPASGTVAFAYLGQRDGVLYALLAGADNHLEPLLPTPPAVEPWRTATATQLQPLPVRLDPATLRGRSEVVVVFVFALRPLPIAEVEAAARRALVEPAAAAAEVSVVVRRIPVDPPVD